MKARGVKYICYYVTMSLIVILSLSACNAEDAVYREYRCYFLFDTQLHPMPCQLTGIIGNPGHFCHVEASLEQGIRHIKTTRNYDGAVEDVPLTTDRENQQSCVLGANNCIIIGTSSYELRLVAYDGQCPNCLTDYNGNNYPLTWQKNGLQLHCAKCDRSYDVNNGVVASGKGGRGLLFYNAALDGALIRAWN